MEKHQGAVYNVLHGEGDNIPSEPGELPMGDGAHEYEDDHDDDEHGHKHHKHAHKREVLESFDFNDVESMMWRKVYCRSESKEP